MHQKANIFELNLHQKANICPRVSAFALPPSMPSLSHFLPRFTLLCYNWDMHGLDAIIGGHICLDITPKFPEMAENLPPSALLLPGTLVTVDGVDIHPGGVVSNTGLAMSFFGNNVRLMGKVGNDEFGTMLLDLIGQREGMIISDRASTSYSIVLALPEQDRIFLHDPGANHSFSSDDLDYNLISSARLFHFGYPPLMRRMYEDNGEELLRIFKKIDNLGVITSLDLAAVDDRSEAASANWEEILSRVLPYVDLFLPSYEELAWMLDRENLERLRSASPSGDPIEALSLERDLPPLAEKAFALGAKVLLVKCGSKGLFGKTSADDAAFKNLCKKAEIKNINVFSSWQNREYIQDAIPPRIIRSATGAGDTCIAAFLTALLRNYEFQPALRIAAAAGSSCLESWDSLGGLKPFEELALV